MKTNNVTMTARDGEREDCYSYSEPGRVRVKHLELELDVEFDERILKGTALLTLDSAFAGNLVLDTRDLRIESVEYSGDLRDFRRAGFELGTPDPVLGAALTVHLPVRALGVRVRYSTSPDASALQWLGAPQSARKKHPFLYTQSAATHARSWLPLQDTPQVRMTYTARVRKPTGLHALMSACNNPNVYFGKDSRFVMPHPIPSYLIALAVGDLDFRELGSRVGVFAERPVIDAAVREFQDIDQMLRAAETLFGPYRWERYDVLVLPPSFPVGGMENPCLTFATPTVIAGDKSLTSLIVHELTHSWSSNLVSNATWRHFWMNEGFAVYMERRIVEELYGRRRAEIEAVSGVEDLKQELARLDPKDQALEPPENGRDPNTGLAQVPYEKGALFLRTLEETFGRERFDIFLRGYFEHFAFQSITTAQFVDYLERNLLSQDPEANAKLSVDEWIHGSGIPAGAAHPKSDALASVEDQAARWRRGEIPLKDIQTSRWTSQEWLHFLKYVSAEIGTAEMRELDLEFHLTNSGNAELEFQWLLMAIRNDYRPAFPRLEQFLTMVGRRKYLKPLYQEMAKTREGKQWALAIYERARSVYHPITRAAINDVLH
jgi:leukotriene-A4 hydrolase